METFARAETHLEDDAPGISSCLSAKDFPGKHVHAVTGDRVSFVAPSPFQASQCDVVK